MSELRMTEWISMEDRLPADKEKYLVRFLNVNTYDFQVMLFDPHRGSFTIEFDNTFVTHWMPLPPI